jgi:hypothetical protein
MSIARDVPGGQQQSGNGRMAGIDERAVVAVVVGRLDSN